MSSYCPIVSVCAPRARQPNSRSGKPRFTRPDYKIREKVDSKMTLYHKDFVERWHTFSLCEQLAHVGSEVSRALNWLEKQNAQFSMNAYERALELMDFTLSDPKNRTRAKELCRLRESLVDYFQGTNEFGSSPTLMRRYFDYFAFAARNSR